VGGGAEEEGDGGEVNGVCFLVGRREEEDEINKWRARMSFVRGRKENVDVLT
jgi:hypothetical protein